MPVNYIDPWEGRVPSLKDSSSSSATPAEKQNSGIFGDLIDSVHRGFYQSFGGDAETIGQLADSETFKSIGRDLSRRANAQTATMSAEGQQALSQRLFTEDENGDLALGDGATNWRTWALQFGTLGGQVLGMIGAGGATSAVAKGAGKLALRVVAKGAMTKEAQQLIAAFGKEKYGQSLFFADAGKTEQDFGY